VTPRSLPLLAVVGADREGAADGIRDYTLRLVEAVGADGRWDVDLHLRRPGAWSPWPSAGRRPDAVLLQYNPFWHGHRGFAPGLVAALHRVRRRGSLVAILAHETYVDMKNPKWVLMGGWQRLQLLGLQMACDLQFCTIERWTERLARTWPRAAAHHLPVPSNLPDRRKARSDGRAACGADDRTFVIGVFGLHHPGRLQGHVLAAAQAVARRGRPVVLVNLGTGPTASSLAAGFRVWSPGFLPEDEIATLVAGMDLLVAPLMDGASTRRTTIMAGLQHGVAVLSTDGHLTDDLLRRHPEAIELVPVRDVDAFARAAARLAGADDERAALAAAGRRLYETTFDWPVLVPRLLDHLEALR
jgi:glycosyltransferase involved in cell wall biosynthesis